MKLRLRGKVWHIVYYDPHTMIRKSQTTKQTGKKLAEAVMTEFEERLSSGKESALRKLKRTIVDHMLSSYIDEYCAARHGEKLLYDTACLAKQLTKYFGLTLVLNLDKSALYSYQARRMNEDGVTGTTARAELMLLRRAFNYMTDDLPDGSVPSPFSKFKLPKANPPRERVLSMEEFDLLYNNSPDWLRPILVCAVGTMLRRNELVTLQWPGVDFEKRTISILTADTKSKRAHCIPMNDSVFQILIQLHNSRGKAGAISPYVFHGADGKPHIPYTVTKSTRKAARKAGIEDFHLHDLRRTGASFLAEQGISPLILQKALNHKDLSTTQIYTRVGSDALKGHINLLDEYCAKYAPKPEKTGT